VEDPLRRATRDDVPALHRIRLAVRENRLVSTVISEADYVEQLESRGRGWLVEADGEPVGFAVVDERAANLWALFVHPDFERLGLGRRLHDELVAWSWSRGLAFLWLTTEPGTRAERFYERAGWTRTGATPSGELRFELLRGAAPSTDAPSAGGGRAR
jgi:GNAT superfamily N-acetyltransferase